MFNKYLVEFLGTMLLVYVILATGNWFAIGAALAIGVLFHTEVFSSKKKYQELFYFSGFKMIIQKKLKNNFFLV